SRVLAVGGSARPRWPDGTRPDLLPGELDWVVGCTYVGQPGQGVLGVSPSRGVGAEPAQGGQTPVRNLMGCNMSFRREAFRLAGRFAEDLGRVGRTPLGCEETELCIRLRQASPGSLIVFRPGAVVHHRVTPDRLTWSYLRRRGWGEGISKAQVSRAVGAEAALSTERDYLRKVIPAALLREVSQGRPAGVLALGAVVSATAAGYLRGTVAGPRLRIRSGLPRLVHGPI